MQWQIQGMRVKQQGTAMQGARKVYCGCAAVHHAELAALRELLLRSPCPLQQALQAARQPLSEPTPARGAAWSSMLNTCHCPAQQLPQSMC
jgi:hypothetical protein